MTGPDLPVLAGRASLRERIAGSLRAALVSGGMVPGATYSVPALAERFGVSATPVREAMLDLAKEGLVAAVPNKGFRVVEIGESELDELTELRRLLEVPTAGRLAGRIPPADLERLRALAGQIQEHADGGDLIGYVEADRTFHLELLGLGGNRQLVDLVDRLRARTRLYGLGRLAAQGQLARSAAEHVELLSALATGDAAAVEDLMSRHIGHVRGIWADRAEDCAAGRP
ncbi:MAG TPA: GntR family transcriptional regulator [Kineosporiaceae bacterium]|nr:GntR family transcriptional regulator [Kineosporiaceae bacterium]